MKKHLSVLALYAGNTFLRLLALMIVFSGYLIIYNVMYISVTKDIRFYGLLKSIGTTPRQLGQRNHPPPR